MQLILKPYELKLKHTFTISRESIDVQPSLIVELKESGLSGFGEATSNPYYASVRPAAKPGPGEALCARLSFISSL